MNVNAITINDCLEMINMKGQCTSIHAKDKQDYIYKQERRAAVMQRWYLVKLIEEYVRSLEFSKLTMDLCKKYGDMKKSAPHNAKALSTATIL